MNETYRRWHRFVEDRDLPTLESILADDVVFHAPTYWKPRTGKMTVMFILTAVAGLFEDFAYERQWVDDRDWALEFSARLGELNLKGVDLMHLNASGLIDSFEVVIRPPNAVAALRHAMEHELEKLQRPPASAPASGSGSQKGQGGSHRIDRITPDQAFPLRRFLLRPMLPSGASHYPGDHDPAALHLGAFTDLGTGEELVGVVSFLPRTQDGESSDVDYQLQGMVTLPAVRNEGIGAALGEVGIARLRDRGANLVWCNGRTPATSFYERLGFRKVGTEFITPGTGPHFRFVRKLSNDTTTE